MARRPFSTAMTPMSEDQKRRLNQAAADGTLPMGAPTTQNSGGPVQAPVNQDQPVVDFVAMATAMGLDPVEVSRAFETKGEAAIPFLESLTKQRGGSVPAAGNPFQLPEFKTMSNSSGAIQTVDPGASSVAAQDGPITSRVNSAVTMVEQDGSPVVNPFKAGAAMRKVGGDVMTEMQTQVETAQQNRAKLQDIQRRRQETLSRIVGEKSAVNDEVAAETLAAQDRINPLIAAKAKVSERLAALQEAGPIESVFNEIRGLVDRTHSKKYLNKREGEIDGQIRSEVSSLAISHDLRSRYFQTLDTQGKLADSLTDEELRNMDEDARANLGVLQGVKQQFDFLGDTVQANNQVLAAQIYARDEYLSKQTPEQILGLLGQAKQNGFVEVQGIKIPVGELQERVHKEEQIQMALEGQRMNLQSGRLALAQQREAYVVNHMTESQLNAAKAAGYVFRGQKFSPQLIDGALTAQMGDRVNQAKLFMESDTGGSLVTGLTNLDAMNRIYTERLGSMYGGQGRNNPAFIQMQKDLTTRLQGVNAKIREAESKGIYRQVAGALSAEVDQIRKTMADNIGQVAMQMSNGDKVGAEFIRGYLAGQPINSEQSFDAMRHFSTTGELPAGLRTNPQARAMMESYKASEAAVDAEYTKRGVKPKAAERDMAIKKAFAKVSPQMVADASFRDVLPAMPEMARRAGVPFGGFTAAQFQNLLHQSDQDGYAYAADKLGLPAATIQGIMEGNYNGPDKAKIAQQITKDVKAEIAQQQAMALMTRMDNIPLAPGERLPGKRSDMFVEALGNPKFQRMLAGFDDYQSGATFGGYLASGTSRGAMLNQVSKWAEGIQRSQAIRTMEPFAQSRQQRGLYNTNPVTRASVILGSIPDLDKAEEQQLLSALKAQIGEPSAIGGIFQVPQMNERMTQLIKGSKFQDPNLERIRKVAATHWDDASRNMDNAIDRLGE